MSIFVIRNFVHFVFRTYMKIYTKTGDTGDTSLLGGKRIKKHCIEMHAIGEVDELNASIGVVISLLEGGAFESVCSHLVKIQHRLFTIGANLAAVQTDLVNVPKLKDADVIELEQWIDAMERELPELTQFILPGGYKAAAYSFFVRAICRRAERVVVKLSEISSFNPLLQKYLNRLSDALFVLGRWINAQQGVVEERWRKD